MIAEQSTVTLPQPRTPTASSEPLSLKRIVAALQVVLATRRAAFTDEDMYWYTIARGL